MADGLLLAVGLRGGLLLLATDTGRNVKAWCRRWSDTPRAIHPAPDHTGVPITADDGRHLIPLPPAP